MMIWIIFFTLATGLIASSILVLYQKSPVHSALFLIIAFLFLAGFYLMLGAEFIAFVHVIVYAGAIMVLFLFVIMLLNLKEDVRGFVLGKHQKMTALVLGILIFIMIVFMIFPATLYREVSDITGLSEQEFRNDNLQAVGALLYSKYLIPFEIASILLIVAMIGAVVLAKKDI